MDDESDSTHKKLPALDEARVMDFAALSKVLRQAVDAGVREGADQENQFSALLEHLRSRLPEIAPIPTIKELKPPAFSDVWRRMVQPLESSFEQYLASLEKGLVAEIDSAISGLGIYKSRPKFARKLRLIELVIQKVPKKLKNQSLRGLSLSEKSIYSQWRMLIVRAIEDYADQKIRFLTTPPSLLLQAHEIEIRTNESSIVRTRRKIVDGLSRDFDRRRELFSEVLRVPWTLLPTGETGIAQLTNYVREFQRRHPERRMRPERFDFAWSLEPTEAYMGNDEFEGYLALVFSHSGRVLLEHPEEGNAAYVFNENWRELSRLSKTVLLQKYCGSFERVLHRETGNWRDVVKHLVGR